MTGSTYFMCLSVISSNSGVGGEGGEKVVAA